MTNPVVDAVALKPCPFCAGRAYSYFRNMGWAQCVEENDCSVHPAVCADTEAEAITAWNTRQSADAALVEALEPFAAMGRVMEARARITFGKVPKDSDILFESSGEVGTGILTMGHFRDAAALLPNAPGWGGVYKPLTRATLTQGERT